jgi:hypothetical protein
MSFPPLPEKTGEVGQTPTIRDRHINGRHSGDIKVWLWWDERYRLLGHHFKLFLIISYVRTYTVDK